MIQHEAELQPKTRTRAGDNRRCCCNVKTLPGNRNPGEMPVETLSFPWGAARGGAPGDELLLPDGAAHAAQNVSM